MLVIVCKASSYKQIKHNERYNEEDHNEIVNENKGYPSHKVLHEQGRILRVRRHVRNVVQIDYIKYT